ANTTASIPPALSDRMEIIRLPGYLDFEKAAIAGSFLIPKLIKEFGLEKLAIEFKKDAVDEIIQNYTREAGVRALERQLASVLRQTAVVLAEGKRLRKLTITKSKVQKLLGAQKFTASNIKRGPTVGYAVGLAWTDFGGVVLPVEVAPLKGRGRLTLTGSIGDVMRESATAALSYVRQHHNLFGLKDTFFDRLELHVHLPEGAVPKDGPSAGITMTTAILSTLTGIPVRTDIAMTGEITLTGDVLAIGGLNEKLLAAKRMGITEIIIPEANRKDLTEIQSDLLEGLKLHFVRKISEVIKLAMLESPYIKKRHRLSNDLSRSLRQ
ncbi:MAG: S16 family serine protease, partial [Candidatus Zixiibacteriota bacterium]